MGGRSKKSGRGGGHHGGGGGRSEPVRLRKDPGVPDLKDVTRKLTHTAQRRNLSLFSLDRARQVKGGAAIGEGLRSRMEGMVLRDAQGNTAAHSSNVHASLEEHQAARRREMATLAFRTAERVHSYEAPLQLIGNEEDAEDLMVEDVDRRGADQSLRRFFKELQRVVEHCDVLLQVVDARDPLGCRLTRLERSIRSSYGEEAKKMVVVLNKVDLLPNKEVIDAWVHYFEENERVMCIPFSATGKGAAGQAYVSDLFRRLRSLARGEGGDRKAIVVGVIGYPNVGKSSVINALKRRNVVGVGNTPGFTTGNTEVELRSDIRVMDCPGVVLPGEDSGDVVLRNAVKLVSVVNPFAPVQRLLQRCTATEVLHSDDEDGKEQRALRDCGVHPLGLFYGIGSFAEDDVMEFIRLVGLRRGRLTKGGAVDEEGTARMILTDWNDGRISYYTCPPEHGSTLGFSRDDPFRVHGGAEDEEAEGNAPTLVSSLSKGITLDGLPTFRLWMRRMDGRAVVSKKKWRAAAAQGGMEMEECTEL